MSLRAVTFDCWGTLLMEPDFEAVTGRRVAAIREHASDGLDPADAERLLDEAWKAHLEAWRGGVHHGSPGMARHCVEALELSGDGVAESLCRAFEESAESLCRAFEEAAEAGSPTALDGAPDTLRTLRETGVRTALVCDTGFTPGRVVRGFLERNDLAEHLEFCAFSNEVGVPKPHERMFRTALEALETEPRDAVHVGDLRRTDIAGANALGMGSVRIADVNDDPPAEGMPEADVVVGSHAELLGALEGLGVPVGG